MMEDLSEEVRRIDKDDIRDLSTTEATALLKQLRKAKLRRPDLVITFGEKLVKNDNSNDAWNIYEQMFTAALDISDVDLAQKCMEKLLQQFPNSIRARRLKGMMCEYSGNFAEALKIYDDLLKENPSNIQCLKRKVCIHKASGSVGSTIDELNKILKYYPSDVTAWVELGELYMSQCKYKEAAHCFEELILLNPNCAHYHTRLAEAYYSIGDSENILNARRHFTMSLNNQAAKYNLRALYGLMQSCTALVQQYSPLSSSGSSKSREERSYSETVEIGSPGTREERMQSAAVNKELIKWANAQLLSVFDQDELLNPSSLSQLVIAVLNE